MRNVANIFSFLCNNSDRTWFFYALTFARSLGRCWKSRPSASVFNISHWTWRKLMHEKPCLIPILTTGVHVHQRRRRISCASAWSDQSLRKAFSFFFKRTAKTFIRLYVCDLILRWTHMSSCRNCCTLALLSSILGIKTQNVLCIYTSYKKKCNFTEIWSQKESNRMKCLAESALKYEYLVQILNPLKTGDP